MIEGKGQMQEVIFYGRGGQGAVTCAALVVQALDYEGKYGQAHPFFGFERRGAPVRAFLRIGEEPLIIRARIYNPDCIVVLDSRLPEFVKVGAGLKKGGIAVLNTTKSPQEINLGVLTSKMGVLDATRISDEIYGAIAIPMTNMIMGGAFSATTGWVSLASLVKAAHHRFKGDIAKNNEKALILGYEATKVVTT